MPQRYFVRSRVAAGVPIALERDDARHARAVMRSRSGDPLTLLAEGVAWDATFLAVSGSEVTVLPSGPSAVQSGELPAEVTIVQAVAKSAKFDEVVEKCVELGAVAIVPAICSRSEAKAGESKLDRWRRVARAAAMQSRRRIVPQIDEPAPWPHIFERLSPRRTALIAYEQAEPATLAAALARYAQGTPIVIGVGPEGGLTAEEIELAQRFGANTVSLGPTILRTETAAPALLAAVAAALGWW